MTLREEALASVRWTAFSTVARTGIQFAQLAILARLLTPADFGVMALTMSLVAVLQIFADLGVNNAIFSRSGLTEEQLSSLYWLNVAASALLALALLAAGPCVAAFYGEPALQALLAMAALTFLLNASWQQLRVRAEKELRFKPLALLEVAASLAGLAAAVGMACAGAGAYALMGAVLAATATGALLGWSSLAGGWRPGFRLRLGEIRDFLAFGAHSIGSDLANALSSQVDIVLGGKFLGASAMGLYSAPKNLCLQIVGVINPIVMRVALPVLARSAEDAGQLQLVYLRTVRMTASVNFPVFTALALFAPEAIGIIFGPRWQGAVAPLRIFAAWALMRSTVNPIGSLALARGRADLLFRWNLAFLLISVPSIAAGVRYGAQGLALTLAAVALFSTVANWVFLVRPLCGAGAPAYFGELAVPLLITAAAAPVAWFAAAAAGGDIARLAVGAASGAAAYLAISAVFNRSWLDTLLALLKLRP